LVGLASARSSRSLIVRPIEACERQRFDETLERSHWLGGGLVGEVMRYVALQDGEWAALIGFGSAALCVRARDLHIGWSEQQRWRRLRYVTNNQRFCVLETHRRPNLASEALSMALRRISSDFEHRWGHPVVLVETFTDPARHLGTCYQASNFNALGRTSGYARKAGRFTHHGVEKVVWTRALHRDALLMLTSDFDHPFLDPSRRAAVTAIDLNRVDLDSESGLLARLTEVPDPRMRRGIRHAIAPILGVAALATVRGNKSFNAIGETAAELPQEALARLGVRVSPHTGKHIAPDSSTIRRTLNAIDRDAFDAIVGSWLAEQVAKGRVTRTNEAARAAQEAKDRGEETPKDQTPDDDPSQDLPAIAVDGKALRGARLGGGDQVHLLSALTHAEGVIVGQRDVDGKTNEITGFAPLLEGLDLEGVVVTADALHTQREHAKFLAKKKAFFVIGLKDNQPKLRQAAETLVEHAPTVHETHDRAHGRIEHRYFRVVTVPAALALELKFPWAHQVIAVDRERCDLDDQMISTETSYYVTNLSAAQAGPKQLARHIRGHWGIENRCHWVRDNTFDEDRSSVRTDSGPQVLATLRNLAISLLRLAGFTNIAKGTRWAAWDLDRALGLMSL
jgi:predicted transposase YbfD/YdcC